MSGYHKSIEVYKFLRKNGVPVIVPIRNLYVSGTHMDVMYIDHNVTITEFTSTSLELYDYTEKTIRVPVDHQLNIIGFDISYNISFVVYTTATVTVPADHQLNIIGFDISDNISFVPFGNVTVSVPVDHQLNIIGLTLDPNITAISLTTAKNDNTDHCITINDFTSTELMIE